MTDRAQLIALAERCEGATGPSRELDAESVVASRLLPRLVEPWVSKYPEWRASPIAGRVEVIGDDGAMAVWFTAPEISASLDSAMGLVPEGWFVEHLCFDWTIDRWSVALATLPSDSMKGVFAGGGTIKLDDARAEATTPALALTAACLRALAHKDHQDAE